MDESKKPVSKRWKPGETRSLNADERISFTVLSLYLFIFCACTYLYWPVLPMKIMGGTAALLGVMLVSTAFLNKGTVPRKHSRYTRRWYLLSFFCGLLVLVALRAVVRHLGTHVAVLSTIGGSLLFLFATFRKAIVQILMAFLAMVFVFVISTNWNATTGGELGFIGALGKCGQVIFRIQPFEEMANSLIAGNYMGYLSKVDYRDRQVNMLAVRTVVDSGDDELQKTKDILRFVSNDIHYVSDPDDGVEYAKDPVSTLIAGGGDCEDQTVLLCSLLESVGLKTFMAFTDNHVFALVRFQENQPELDGIPQIDIEGHACYVLDASDPEARIGHGSARPDDIKRIFDVRSKALVQFSVPAEE